MFKSLLKKATDAIPAVGSVIDSVTDSLDASRHSASNVDASTSAPGSSLVHPLVFTTPPEHASDTDSPPTDVTCFEAEVEQLDSLASPLNVTLSEFSATPFLEYIDDHFIASYGNADTDTEDTLTLAEDDFFDMPCHDIIGDVADGLFTAAYMDALNNIRRDLDNNDALNDADCVTPLRSKSVAQLKSAFQLEVHSINQDLVEQVLNDNIALRLKNDQLEVRLLAAVSTADNETAAQKELDSLRRRLEVLEYENEFLTAEVTSHQTALDKYSDESKQHIAEKEALVAEVDEKDYIIAGLREELMHKFQEVDRLAEKNACQLEEKMVLLQKCEKFECAHKTMEAECCNLSEEVTHLQSQIQTIKVTDNRASFSRSGSLFKEISEENDNLTLKLDHVINENISLHEHVDELSRSIHALRLRQDSSQSAHTVDSLNTVENVELAVSKGVSCKSFSQLRYELIDQTPTVDDSEQSGSADPREDVTGDHHTALTSNVAAAASCTFPYRTEPDLHHLPDLPLGIMDIDKIYETTDVVDEPSTSAGVVEGEVVENLATSAILSAPMLVENGSHDRFQDVPLQSRPTGFDQDMIYGLTTNVLSAENLLQLGTQPVQQHSYGVPEKSSDCDIIATAVPGKSSDSFSHLDIETIQPLPGPTDEQQYSHIAVPISDSLNLFELPIEEPTERRLIPSTDDEVADHVVSYVRMSDSMFLRDQQQVHPLIAREEDMFSGLSDQERQHILRILALAESAGGSPPGGAIPSYDTSAVSEEGEYPDTPFADVQGCYTTVNNQAILDSRLVPTTDDEVADYVVCYCCTSDPILLTENQKVHELITHLDVDCGHSAEEGQNMVHILTTTDAKAGGTLSVDELEAHDRPVILQDGMDQSTPFAEPVTVKPVEVVQASCLRNSQVLDYDYESTEATTTNYVGEEDMFATLSDEERERAQPAVLYHIFHQENVSSDEIDQSPVIITANVIKEALETGDLQPSETFYSDQIDEHERIEYRLIPSLGNEVADHVVCYIRTSDSIPSNAKQKTQPLTTREEDMYSGLSNEEREHIMCVLPMEEGIFEPGESSMTGDFPVYDTSVAFQGGEITNHSARGEDMYIGLSDEERKHIMRILAMAEGVPEAGGSSSVGAYDTSVAFREREDRNLTSAEVPDCYPTEDNQVVLEFSMPATARSVEVLLQPCLAYILTPATDYEFIETTSSYIAASDPVFLIQNQNAKPITMTEDDMFLGLSDEEREHIMRILKIAEGGYGSAESTVSLHIFHEESVSDIIAPLPELAIENCIMETQEASGPRAWKTCHSVEIVKEEITECRLIPSVDDEVADVVVCCIRTSDSIPLIEKQKLEPLIAREEDMYSGLSDEEREHIMRILAMAEGVPEAGGSSSVGAYDTSVASQKGKYRNLTSAEVPDCYPTEDDQVVFEFRMPATDRSTEELLQPCLEYILTPATDYEFIETTSSYVTVSNPVFEIQKQTAEPITVTEDDMFLGLSDEEREHIMRILEMAEGGSGSAKSTVPLHIFHEESVSDLIASLPELSIENCIMETQETSGPRAWKTCHSVEIVKEETTECRLIPSVDDEVADYVVCYIRTSDAIPLIEKQKLEPLIAREEDMYSGLSDEEREHIMRILAMAAGVPEAGGSSSVGAYDTSVASQEGEYRNLTSAELADCYPTEDNQVVFEFRMPATARSVEVLLQPCLEYILTPATDYEFIETTSSYITASDPVFLIQKQNAKPITVTENDMFLGLSDEEREHIMRILEMAEGGYGSAESTVPLHYFHEESVSDLIAPLPELAIENSIMETQETSEPQAWKTCHSDQVVKEETTECRLIPSVDDEVADYVVCYIRTSVSIPLNEKQKLEPLIAREEDMYSGLSDEEREHIMRILAMAEGVPEAGGSSSVGAYDTSVASQEGEYRNLTSAEVPDCYPTKDNQMVFEFRMPATARSVEVLMQPCLECILTPATDYEFIETTSSYITASDPVFLIQKQTAKPITVTEDDMFLGLSDEEPEHSMRIFEMAEEGSGSAESTVPLHIFHEESAPDLIAPLPQLAIENCIMETKETSEPQTWKTCYLVDVVKEESTECRLIPSVDDEVADYAVCYIRTSDSIPLNEKQKLQPLIAREEDMYSGLSDEEREHIMRILALVEGLPEAGGSSSVGGYEPSVTFQVEEDRNVTSAEVPDCYPTEDNQVVLEFSMPATARSVEVLLQPSLEYILTPVTDYEFIETTSTYITASDPVFLIHEQNAKPITVTEDDMFLGLSSEEREHIMRILEMAEGGYGSAESTLPLHNFHERSASDLIAPLPELAVENCIVETQETSDSQAWKTCHSVDVVKEESTECRLIPSVDDEVADYVVCYIRTSDSIPLNEKQKLQPLIAREEDMYSGLSDEEREHIMRILAMAEGIPEAGGSSSVGGYDTSLASQEEEDRNLISAEVPDCYPTEDNQVVLEFSMPATARSVEILLQPCLEYILTPATDYEFIETTSSYIAASDPVFLTQNQNVKPINVTEDDMFLGLSDEEREHIMRILEMSEGGYGSADSTVPLHIFHEESVPDLIAPLPELAIENCIVETQETSEPQAWKTCHSVDVVKEETTECRLIANVDDEVADYVVCYIRTSDSIPLNEKQKLQPLIAREQDMYSGLSDEEREHIMRILALAEGLPEAGGSSSVGGYDTSVASQEEEDRNLTSAEVPDCYPTEDNQVVLEFSIPATARSVEVLLQPSLEYILTPVTDYEFIETTSAYITASDPVFLIHEQNAKPITVTEDDMFLGLSSEEREHIMRILEMAEGGYGSAESTLPLHIFHEESVSDLIAPLPELAVENCIVETQETSDSQAWKTCHSVDVVKEEATECRLIPSVDDEVADYVVCYIRTSDSIPLNEKQKLQPLIAREEDMYSGLSDEEREHIVRILAMAEGIPEAGGSSSVGGYDTSVASQEEEDRNLTSAEVPDCYPTEDNQVVLEFSMPATARSVEVLLQPCLEYILTPATDYEFIETTSSYIAASDPVFLIQNQNVKPINVTKDDMFLGLSDEEREHIMRILEMSEGGYGSAESTLPLYIFYEESVSDLIAPLPELAIENCIVEAQETSEPQAWKTCHSVDVVKEESTECRLIPSVDDEVADYVVCYIRTSDSIPLNEKQKLQPLIAREEDMYSGLSDEEREHIMRILALAEGLPEAGGSSSVGGYDTSVASQEEEDRNLTSAEVPDCYPTEDNQVVLEFSMPATARSVEVLLQPCLEYILTPATDYEFIETTSSYIAASDPVFLIQNQNVKPINVTKDDMFLGLSDEEREHIMRILEMSEGGYGSAESTLPLYIFYEESVSDLIAPLPELAIENCIVEAQETSEPQAWKTCHSVDVVKEESTECRLIPSVDDEVADYVVCYIRTSDSIPLNEKQKLQPLIAREEDMYSGLSDEEREHIMRILALAEGLPEDGGSSSVGGYDTSVASQEEEDRNLTSAEVPDCYPTEDNQVVLEFSMPATARSVEVLLQPSLEYILTPVTDYEFIETTSTYITASDPVFLIHEQNAKPITVTEDDMFLGLSSEEREHIMRILEMAEGGYGSAESTLPLHIFHEESVLDLIAPLPELAVENCIVETQETSDSQAWKTCHSVDVVKEESTECRLIPSVDDEVADYVVCYIRTSDSIPLNEKQKLQPLIAREEDMYSGLSDEEREHIVRILAMAEGIPEAGGSSSVGGYDTSVASQEEEDRNLTSAEVPDCYPTEDNQVVLEFSMPATARSVEVLLQPCLEYILTPATDYKFIETTSSYIAASDPVFLIQNQNVKPINVTEDDMFLGLSDEEREHIMRILEMSEGGYGSAESTMPLSIFHEESVPDLIAPLPELAIENCIVETQETSEPQAWKTCHSVDVVKEETTECRLIASVDDEVADYVVCYIRTSDSIPLNEKQKLQPLIAREEDMYSGLSDEEREHIMRILALAEGLPEAGGSSSIGGYDTSVASQEEEDRNLTSAEVPDCYPTEDNQVVLEFSIPATARSVEVLLQPSLEYILTSVTDYEFIETTSTYITASDPVFLIHEQNAKPITVTEDDMFLGLSSEEREHIMRILEMTEGGYGSAESTLTLHIFHAESVSDLIAPLPELAVENCIVETQETSDSQAWKTCHSVDVVKKEATECRLIPSVDDEVADYVVCYIRTSDSIPLNEKQKLQPLIAREEDMYSGLSDEEREHIVRILAMAEGIPEVGGSSSVGGYDTSVASQEEEDRNLTFAEVPDCYPTEDNQVVLEFSMPATARSVEVLLQRCLEYILTPATDYEFIETTSSYIAASDPVFLTQNQNVKPINVTEDDMFLGLSDEEREHIMRILEMSEGGYGSAESTVPLYIFHDESVSDLIAPLPELAIENCIVEAQETSEPQAWKTCHSVDVVKEESTECRLIPSVDDEVADYVVYYIRTSDSIPLNEKQKLQPLIAREEDMYSGLSDEEREHIMRILVLAEGLPEDGGSSSVGGYDTSVASQEEEDRNLTSAEVPDCYPTEDNQVVLEFSMPATARSVEVLLQPSLEYILTPVTDYEFIETTSTYITASDPVFLIHVQNAKPITVTEDDMFLGLSSEEREHIMRILEMAEGGYGSAESTLPLHIFHEESVLDLIAPLPKLAVENCIVETQETSDSQAWKTCHSVDVVKEESTECRLIPSVDDEVADYVVCYMRTSDSIPLNEKQKLQPLIAREEDMYSGLSDEEREHIMRILAMAEGIPEAGGSSSVGGYDMSVASQEEEDRNLTSAEVPDCYPTEDNQVVLEFSMPATARSVEVLLQPCLEYILTPATDYEFIETTSSYIAASDPVFLIQNQNVKPINVTEDDMFLGLSDEEREHIMRILEMSEGGYGSAESTAPLYIFHEESVSDLIAPLPELAIENCIVEAQETSEPQAWKTCHSVDVVKEESTECRLIPSVDDEVADYVVCYIRTSDSIPLNEKQKLQPLIAREEDMYSGLSDEEREHIMRILALAEGLPEAGGSSWVGGYDTSVASQEEEGRNLTSAEVPDCYPTEDNQVVLEFSMPATARSVEVLLQPSLEYILTPVTDYEFIETTSTYITASDPVFLIHEQNAKPTTVTEDDMFLGLSSEEREHIMRILEMAEGGYGSAESTLPFHIFHEESVSDLIAPLPELAVENCIVETQETSDSQAWKTCHSVDVVKEESTECRLIPSADDEVADYVVCYIRTSDSIPLNEKQKLQPLIAREEDMYSGLSDEEREHIMLILAMAEGIPEAGGSSSVGGYDTSVASQEEEDRNLTSAEVPDCYPTEDNQVVLEFSMPATARSVEVLLQPCLEYILIPATDYEFIDTTSSYIAASDPVFLIQNQNVKPINVTDDDMFLGLSDEEREHIMRILEMSEGGYGSAESTVPLYIFHEESVSDLIAPLPELAIENCIVEAQETSEPQAWKTCHSVDVVKEESTECRLIPSVDDEVADYVVCYIRTSDSIPLNEKQKLQPLIAREEDMYSGLSDEEREHIMRILALAEGLPEAGGSSSVGGYDTSVASQEEEDRNLTSAEVPDCYPTEDNQVVLEFSMPATARSVEVLLQPSLEYILTPVTDYEFIETTSTYITASDPVFLIHEQNAKPITVTEDDMFLGLSGEEREHIMRILEMAEGGYGSAKSTMPLHIFHEESVSDLIAPLPELAIENCIVEIQETSEPQAWETCHSVDVVKEESTECRLIPSVDDEVADYVVCYIRTSDSIPLNEKQNLQPLMAREEDMYSGLSDEEREHIMRILAMAEGLPEPGGSSSVGGYDTSVASQEEEDRNLTSAEVPDCYPTEDNQVVLEFSMPATARSVEVLLQPSLEYILTPATDYEFIETTSSYITASDPVFLIQKQNAKPITVTENDMFLGLSAEEREHIMRILEMAEGGYGNAKSTLPLHISHEESVSDLIVPLPELAIENCIVEIQETSKPQAWETCHSVDVVKEESTKCRLMPSVDDEVADYVVCYIRTSDSIPLNEKQKLQPLIAREEDMFNGLSDEEREHIMRILAMAEGLPEPGGSSSVGGYDTSVASQEEEDRNLTSVEVPDCYPTEDNQVVLEFSMPATARSVEVLLQPCLEYILTPATDYEFIETTSSYIAASDPVFLIQNQNAKPINVTEDDTFLGLSDEEREHIMRILEMSEGAYGSAESTVPLYIFHEESVSDLIAPLPELAIENCIVETQETSEPQAWKTCHSFDVVKEETIECRLIPSVDDEVADYVVCYIRTSDLIHLNEKQKPQPLIAREEDIYSGLSDEEREHIMRILAMAEGVPEVGGSSSVGGYEPSVTFQVEEDRNVTSAEVPDCYPTEDNQVVFNCPMPATTRSVEVLLQPCLEYILTPATDYEFIETMYRYITASDPVFLIHKQSAKPITVTEDDMFLGLSDEEREHIMRVLEMADGGYGGAESTVPINIFHEESVSDLSAPLPELAIENCFVETQETSEPQAWKTCHLVKVVKEETTECRLIPSVDDEVADYVVCYIRTSDSIPLSEKQKLQPLIAREEDMYSGLSDEEREHIMRILAMAEGVPEAGGSSSVGGYDTSTASQEGQDRNLTSAEVPDCYPTEDNQVVLEFSMPDTARSVEVLLQPCLEYILTPVTDYEFIETTSSYITASDPVFLIQKQNARPITVTEDDMFLGLSDEEREHIMRVLEMAGGGFGSAESTVPLHIFYEESVSDLIVPLPELAIENCITETQETSEPQAWKTCHSVEVVKEETTECRLIPSVDDEVADYVVCYIRTSDSIPLSEKQKLQPLIAREEDMYSGLSDEEREHIMRILAMAEGVPEAGGSSSVGGYDTSVASQDGENRNLTSAEVPDCYPIEDNQVVSEFQMPATDRSVEVLLQPCLEYIPTPGTDYEFIETSPSYTTASALVSLIQKQNAKPIIVTEEDMFIGLSDEERDHILRMLEITEAGQRSADATVPHDMFRQENVSDQLHHCIIAPCNDYESTKSTASYFTASEQVNMTQKQTARLISVTEDVMFIGLSDEEREHITRMIEMAERGHGSVELAEPQHVFHQENAPNLINPFIMEATRNVATGAPETSELEPPETCCSLEVLKKERNEWQLIPIVDDEMADSVACYIGTVDSKRITEKQTIQLLKDSMELKTLF